MTTETKTDRQRRLARERHRRSERDALRCAALAPPLNMDMYQKRLMHSDLICAAGGFAEPAEAVTLLHTTLPNWAGQ